MNIMVVKMNIMVGKMNIMVQTKNMIVFLIILSQLKDFNLMIIFSFYQQSVILFVLLCCFVIYRYVKKNFILLEICVWAKQGF